MTEVQTIVLVWALKCVAAVAGYYTASRFIDWAKAKAIARTERRRG